VDKRVCASFGAPHHYSFSSTCRTVHRLQYEIGMRGYRFAASSKHADLETPPPYFRGASTAMKKRDRDIEAGSYNRNTGQLRSSVYDRLFAPVPHGIALSSCSMAMRKRHSAIFVYANPHRLQPSPQSTSSGPQRSSGARVEPINPNWIIKMS
jgi:hypothetical protein